MSSKLPYEDTFEKKMNDLPSENEDTSWQKMKHLLDENDNDNRGVFSNRMKLGILILLLLLTGLWLILEFSKTTNKKAITATGADVKAQQKTAGKQFANPKNQARITKPIAGNVPKQKRENNGENTDSDITVNDRVLKTTATAKHKLNRKQQLKLSLAKSISKQYEGEQYAVSRSNKYGVQKRSVPGDGGANTTTDGNPKNTNKKEVSGSTEKEIAGSLNKLSMPPNQAEVMPNADSAALEAVATKDKNAGQKPMVPKISKYIISGGIGLQQQLPVAGQKIVPYGYNGNKNPFSDYIPSLYLRLEKENKWFIQGEFVYSAPQLVKEFPYSKQTQANNFGVTISTTTLNLKKTFYNAVPFSFNYYIQPKWSLGIGGVYSWLHGAVIEREITTTNVQTQAQSVSKQIVPIKGYTDSFLYRSHIYLLLQTDYAWRRFSAGLRYRRDMQPYIKYTKPDGTINTEKASSLEFILRFRIFKTAKFSIR